MLSKFSLEYNWFLWPYLITAFVSAFLSDSVTSYRLDSYGAKHPVKRDWFFAFVAAGAMSLFLGLRIYCNDTGSYVEVYNYIIPSSGPLLQGLSWKLGDSPVYYIIVRIIKHLGFSPQDYLMFFSWITNFINIWFLRKYAAEFFFSLYLYWTMGLYMFIGAGMRQAFAMAIGLIAIDCWVRKKMFWFWVLILLGTLVHPYLIIWGIAPFLTFSPWTKKTYYLLGIFAVAGVSLQTMMGTVVSVTSMLGKNYSEETLLGDGVNIFRLLVVWAPVVLSFFARDEMKKSTNKVENLFMNFSMLNAEIMFVALFGTANYFARLANYFVVFQTFSLPWILKYFERTNRFFIKVAIYVCYALYFLYAYFIQPGRFDYYIAIIPLKDYLHTLFGNGAM